MTGKPVMYGDARRWLLLHADSLALMAKLPADSIDAVITDPPYGIGFSGETWDGGPLADPRVFQEWNRAWATEALRVLKPGGWLAAFGSPRTFHRLVVGVENAGFEIRDRLLWLYAQGVPKSRRRADGLSTTLKPAYEPILLARRPFSGTLDTNLAAHGTGALQIDRARVPSPDGDKGYWPANVALSHKPTCRPSHCATDCAAALIDRAAGRDVIRLFFAAKTSRREREAGLDPLPLQETSIYWHAATAPRLVRNVHPTVKPLSLMRWLTRLLCPPAGTILDPFAGSGSGGVAGVLEGRRFVGIERDARYASVARARITHWAALAAQETELP